MPSRPVSKVPHVPRVRALLDARAMVRDPLSLFERYRRELGPTYTLHLGGARAAVVSTEPAFVQHVLQKNAANYRMSDIRVKRMGEFQGQGLLNSHGDAWLRKRRFLGRGFSPDRLSELVPMQARVLVDSMERLDSEATQGSVDMGRMLLWINFRLVANAVFGSGMRDDEIEQVAFAIRTIQRFMLRQIVQPYLIPWYRLSGQTRHHQAMRLDAERIARRFIADRRGSAGTREGDLLEVMLETPYPRPGSTMSDEQILVEALQLFVAGNETSPTALSWAFYLLGRHPWLFADMREEIDSVFGSGPPTFEGLGRLDLTRRVLEETLRLYPSFWMIDRVAVDDDLIGSVRIPRGLMVLTYLYGLHRNPESWPDPETFDPGRFEADPRKARSPFAYLPFGGGARKCIGHNMAMVQMLLVLVELVRRYDFELVSTEPVEIQPMMILHPKSPIEMNVRRAGR